ncbi:uncharacterized protein N7458_001202 [Penicillium daleae]|uniref:Uncharacterized protein n=1 Tax=Penicillium daleae TaxID=63821 RepID=A0AAD6CD08_9EURO|nr:uncharacterized protein N7458_001202 [Penicillium daleae]KAJ5459650.1 hypothetical protein N7458_001202 [Penicillium daleae]
MMTSDILKPLAAFCRDPRSQEYISTVKNISASGNSFGTTLSTSSSDGLIVIETTFDMALQIIHGPDEPTSVAMSTYRSPVPDTSSKLPKELLRCYEIGPEYGTDFISEKPTYASHVGADLDSITVLSSYPSCVRENYLKWVKTWEKKWQLRRGNTREFRSSVFFSAEEEVSWNVAGYLLAWRIAMAPDVGLVEYSTSRSQYILQTGKETSITMQFLKEQLYLLEKGDSS